MSMHVKFGQVFRTIARTGQIYRVATFEGKIYIGLLQDVVLAVAVVIAKTPNYRLLKVSFVPMFIPWFSLVRSSPAIKQGLFGSFETQNSSGSCLGSRFLNGHP